MKAKTFFQTDRSYVPRLGIPADGVVVHRHGVDFEDINAAISSWQARGGTVGRMFFVDSDGANAYWTGNWDGVDHSDDVEQSEGGKQNLCAGVESEISTVLVLSGVTSREAVESFAYRPDMILNGVGDILG